MKLCIVGAGAIGGLLGARLGAAGHEVTLLARGAHLDAMRERGLELRTKVGTERLRVNATDRVAELGPQDAVFITLKAYAVPAMLPQLAPLFAPETVMIPAMNGVPWWYFYKEGGRFDGQAVDSVDPGGQMLARFDCARILGCVVYVSSEVIAPGVIRHSGGRRFYVGEPDGSRSARAERIARMLEAGGWEAPVSTRIRDEVWTKLIGNLAFNPIGALTCSPMSRALDDPGVNALVRTILAEGMRVGAAYGARFGMSIEERLDIVKRLDGAKVSMLQDLERGRPIESEAIVGAVCELARRAGVETPTTDMIYALIRQRGRK